MLRALASYLGNDGSVEVEHAESPDEFAHRSPPTLGTVVLLDTSYSPDLAGRQNQRLRELLPGVPQVALVHSTRLATVWHFQALCHGEIAGIVDLFTPHQYLLASLEAVTRGAMVVRLEADIGHTTALLTRVAAGPHASMTTSTYPSLGRRAEFGPLKARSDRADRGAFGARGRFGRRRLHSRKIIAPGSYGDETIAVPVGHGSSVTPRARADRGCPAGGRPRA